MPGFGKILTEDEIRAISMYERSLDPVEQSTVEFAELYAPGGDS
jgi:mono/diheme cytochrome c family protein